MTVYKSWEANKYSNVWCRDNYIQARSLRRAQNVRKQLLAILERYKFPIRSCDKDYARICKAICAGYFTNCARKTNDGY